MRLDLMTLDGVRRSAGLFGGVVGSKELEVVQFQGEPFLRAIDPSRPDPTVSDGETRSPHAGGTLVSAVTPEKGVFTSFELDRVLDAARAAMPGVDVVDTTSLQEYDGYYYGRPGTRALPVVRVRFGDPQQTWLRSD